MKLGIVGAGLMTTQLATLFLRRLELPLVITDVDEPALERARAAIEAGLVMSAETHRLLPTLSPSFFVSSSISIRRPASTTV